MLFTVTSTNGFYSATPPPPSKSGLNCLKCKLWESLRNCTIMNSASVLWHKSQSLKLTPLQWRLLEGSPEVWRDRNRNRACRSASHRTILSVPGRIIWATPHHLSYAAPCELRRTLWTTPHPVSYAAHCELRCYLWAMPHHVSYATPVSYAAPCELRRNLWATLHPVSHAASCELRRTLWTTPHPVSYAAICELRRMHRVSYGAPLIFLPTKIFRIFGIAFTYTKNIQYSIKVRNQEHILAVILPLCLFSF